MPDIAVNTRTISEFIRSIEGRRRRRLSKSGDHCRVKARLTTGRDYDTSVRRRSLSLRAVRAARCTIADSRCGTTRRKIRFLAAGVRQPHNYISNTENKICLK